MLIKLVEVKKLELEALAYNTNEIFISFVYVQHEKQVNVQTVQRSGYQLKHIMIAEMQSYAIAQKTFRSLIRIKRAVGVPEFEEEIISCS